MKHTQLTRFWLLLPVLCLLLGQSKSVLGGSDGNYPGQAQIDWLIAQQDLHSTGLLESYEDNNDTTAFTFDQAVAIIAFTTSGELERAREILNTMKSIQLNDSKNSWFECYNAVDATYGGCYKHVTGPIAWMVMAVNFYECRTEDPNYAPVARMALGWLDTMMHKDDPNDERYGSLKWSDYDLNIISTEHALDAYSAYYWRGMLDANDSYLYKASLILDYLRREMWAPSPNSNCVKDVNVFWRGYNDWTFATDCQSWGVLCLGPRGPDGEEFHRALNLLLENPYGGTRTVHDYNESITDVNGFKSWVGFWNICDPNQWLPNTGDLPRVWVDGTEHVAAALYSIGDDNNGDYFHNQMGRIIDSNGGLVNSFSETNPEEYEDYRYNYVASAAWYYFNEVRLNPFNLRPCPAECRAANIDGTGRIDFIDYAILAKHWLDEGSDLEGDINRDRRVQNIDLDILTEYWLKNCPADEPPEAREPQPHCYSFDDKYVYDANWFTPDAWSDVNGKLVNDANIVDGTLWLPSVTSHDYVDLSGIEFFDEFSIEVNVNIPSDREQIQTIIANTGSTADRDGFKLFVNSFAHPGDWEICFESGTGSQYSGKQVRTPANTFTPGIWQHIKVTVGKVSSKDRVSIYLNYEPCDSNYDPNAKASGWGADGFNRGGAKTLIGQMTDGKWPMRGFIESLCIHDLYTSRPAGDLDDNCIVDMPDLGILTEQWLQAPSCPSADIAPPGGDGVIDFMDFAKLGSQWLRCEPL